MPHRQLAHTYPLITPASPLVFSLFFFVPGEQREVLLVKMLLSLISPRFPSTRPSTLFSFVRVWVRVWVWYVYAIAL